METAAAVAGPVAVSGQDTALGISNHRWRHRCRTVAAGGTWRTASIFAGSKPRRQRHSRRAVASERPSSSGLCGSMGASADRGAAAEP
eukprot:6599937-Prymnesium_polylepis.1